MREVEAVVNVPLRALTSVPAVLEALLKTKLKAASVLRKLMLIKQHAEF
jgi:hypothetical protein